MNRLQMYEYYKSMPLDSLTYRGELYPNYVTITGLSIHHPHPHEHYDLETFIYKLDNDSDFNKFMLDKIKKINKPTIIGV